LTDIQAPETPVNNNTAINISVVQTTTTTIIWNTEILYTMNLGLDLKGLGIGVGRILHWTWEDSFNVVTVIYLVRFSASVISASKSLAFANDFIENVPTSKVFAKFQLN